MEWLQFFAPILSIQPKPLTDLLDFQRCGGFISQNFHRVTDHIKYGKCYEALIFRRDNAGAVILSVVDHAQKNADAGNCA